MKENPEYKDYETTNYVTKHQRLNNNYYKTISGKTTVYTNSSFPRTIFDWNQLGDTSQPTIDSFRKRSLNKRRPDPHRLKTSIERFDGNIIKI